MRTFEFKDGKSNKFWNIELEGKSFTVSYGRIGTDGQTQTKEFADAAKAKTAHDKLVAEKVGKGYVETTGGAVTTSTKSGKALENAILANPDDLAAHAAYADWLSEQGDPRGEFIQVQLALEDPKKAAKERKELQKRESELLKKHKKEWFGELDEFLHDKETDHRYELARGWLDRLHVSSLNVKFSRALARSALARPLRRLVIEGTAYEEEGEYEAGDDIPEDTYNPSVHPIARATFSNVRVFQLGELAEEDYPNCHMSGETAVDMIRKMPRIEEIYLLAHNVNMEALFKLKTLDHLRVLQVYHMNAYPLEALARNSALGQLTHLLFHPHADDLEVEAPYIRRAGVVALVQSPHLKSLTHLRLRLSDLGDEGCEALVRSGLLRRLKVLDLRHGCVTDEGANTLAKSGALGNLELLDLSNNCLTSAGIKALKDTKVEKLLVEKQWQPSGDEQNDNQYLYEGDIE